MASFTGDGVEWLVQRPPACCAHATGGSMFVRSVSTTYHRLRVRVQQSWLGSEIIWTVKGQKFITLVAKTILLVLVQTQHVTHNHKFHFHSILTKFKYINIVLIDLRIETSKYQFSCETLVSCTVENVLLLRRKSHRALFYSFCLGCNINFILCFVGVLFYYYFFFYYTIFTTTTTTSLLFFVKDFHRGEETDNAANAIPHIHLQHRK